MYSVVVSFVLGLFTFLGDVSLIKVWGYSAIAFMLAHDEGCVFE